MKHVLRLTRVPDHSSCHSLMSASVVTDAWCSKLDILFHKSSRNDIVPKTENKEIITQYSVQVVVW